MLISLQRWRKVAEGIVKSVTETYWRAASASKLMPKLDPLLAEAETILAASRKAGERNLQAPAQLLEFQQAMIQVIGELRRMKTDLVAAKIQLALLVNAAPGDRLELSTPVSEIRPAFGPTRALEDTALALRPELRVEAYQEKVDQQEIYKEILKMMPGFGMASLDFKRTADQIAAVGKQMSRTTSNATTAGSQPESDRVRYELTALLTAYEQDRAAASLQTSLADLYTSVGVDLVPVNADLNDLPTSTRQISASLDHWSHGEMPALPPAPVTVADRNQRRLKSSLAIGKTISHLTPASLRAFALVAAALLSAAPVQAAAPDLRDAPVGVQVVATNSTQIGAPTAGMLSVFPFRDGDRFKAGDTLAELRCDQQRATLLHAGAEALKRRHVPETQQQLRALGTYSTLDYKVAGAELQAAEADLAMAQAAAAQCVVKAPFAGRVSGTAVRNFQFVPVGASMLDILDDSSLELELIVPSAWLQWMAPGLPFAVMVRETGQNYAAAVTRFSGRVDPVSQTVKVYGRITGPAAGLLPGMSGEADLRARG